MASSMGDGDHRNHFNLIRLVAASLVVVSHSAALVGVSASIEPEARGYAFTWGGIAVNIFFVISGFLVTASLVRRDDPIAFLWARALRIFPALWVMLVLTVFGLGLFLTILSPWQYLTSPQTWRYFLHCASVVGGVAFYLPGVFTAHSDQVFNRSLWTLPLELRLYLVLGLSWVALAPWARSRRSLLLALVLLVIALGLEQTIEAWFVEGQLYAAAANVFMFAMGALFHLTGAAPLRARWTTPVAMLALGISTVEPGLFFCVYFLALPFLVMQLAHLRCDWLLRFNGFGDYSYGLYVFSFPVQQTLLALFPSLGFFALNGAAWLITLLIAMASWRYVEKPMLDKKQAWTARTRKWIAAPAT